MLSPLGKIELLKPALSAEKADVIAAQFEKLGQANSRGEAHFTDIVGQKDVHMEELKAMYQKLAEQKRKNTISTYRGWRILWHKSHHGYDLASPIERNNIPSRP